MLLKELAVIVVAGCMAVGASAQTDTLKVDTSYYERFPDKLIISPYLVKNPIGVYLVSPDATDKVRYHSNSPLGIGLRVGYDWLSLSGSYGVGAIDPNFNKSKGKTKRLNLQTTFAARKLLVDVYFQSYKGFYLLAKDIPQYTQADYYVRPDLKSSLFGATGMYVFNGKKFTPRPIFKYDALQKKSAGSLLAGIEFLAGSAKGDSVFIPSAYSDQYPHSSVNKINYMLFGPSLGYGHSFVIGKHFSIMGIASLNADVGYVKEYETGVTEVYDKRWRFDPNLNFRGGIAYNKPSWELAFSYFTKRMYMTGKSNESRYLAHNNDYRIAYTRRINAGKTIPKVVGWAGNIIEKLGFGFLIR